MATRFLANGMDTLRNAPSGALREEDYRTFCAALESTQRGRDFLAEYTRRNRNADTEMLLDALDRIETMMQADGAARDRLRDELRVLLIAIRLARPDIDSATALTKAARLVDLLDLMERRLDAMVENKDLLPITEEPEHHSVFAPAGLSVVPRPDEPELPIPSSASPQPPPMSLVQDVTIQEAPKPAPPPEVPKPDVSQSLPQPEPVAQNAALQKSTPPAPAPQETAIQALARQEAAKPQRALPAQPYPLFADESVEKAPEEKWLPDFGGDETQIIHTKPVQSMAFMPEVAFIGAPPPKTPAPTSTPLVAEAAVAVEVAMVAEPAVVAPSAAEPAPSTVRAQLRDHPLAAIMSLTEEERIALFT